MADAKISALTNLTAADAINDMIPIVDVSDTPPASGNTKRISINNILSSSPTASGALTVTGLVTAGSATITGAATVGTTLGVTGVSTFAAGTALLPALTTTGDTNTGIYYPAADTFAITTGGTERLRVNSAGNVGLGITPNTWDSPYKCVQLNGGSLSVYPSTDLYLSQNAYNSGGWKRVAAGYASQYIQTNSEHRFLIAATSPTVDSAITFTQAMTLDASGNFLVGLTSNPNTARAYFRYDTLTTQPVINSASIVAAGTGWNHFIGQSGNGSSVTTNNIFIRGNGNVENANGVYGTISDLRLKENISDARNYLADLLKLRVVKYSLKSEESDVATKIGFIAQEVEQVFPSLITTDTDDNKSIKTSVLIPMLLKAIQELTARVQTLEAR